MPRCLPKCAELIAVITARDRSDLGINRCPRPRINSLIPWNEEVGHRVGCQHGNARAWPYGVTSPLSPENLEIHAASALAQQLERVGSIASAGPYPDLEVEVDYLFELPTEIRDRIARIWRPFAKTAVKFGPSARRRRPLARKPRRGTPIIPLPDAQFRTATGFVAGILNASTHTKIRFLNGKPFWNARLKPRGASSISVCNPSSFWVNQWSLGLRREQR